MYPTVQAVDGESHTTSFRYWSKPPKYSGVGTRPQVVPCFHPDQNSPTARTFDGDCTAIPENSATPVRLPVWNDQECPSQCSSSSPECPPGWLLSAQPEIQTSFGESAEMLSSR